MQNKENTIPYTATTISILARFVFMYLLYKNKSTNHYSLIFCLLSISSSSLWLQYSIRINDYPLIYRSSSEITLLFLSSIYIIKNKIIEYQQNKNKNNFQIQNLESSIKSESLAIMV